MPSTDIFSLFAIELILVGLSAFAALRDRRIRINERRNGLEATVTRGEPAMNALYIIYGIATVVYSLVAQVASGIEGNRVIIIVLNYVFLTHLFFFSVWFRNSVFFPMLRRLRQG